MVSSYSKNGFFKKTGFFTSRELQAIEPALLRFHDKWLKNNGRLYENGTINSAYITNRKHLSGQDRMALFQFISQDKLMDIVSKIIGECPAFMNTQLFFNPKNETQKNYWHRDGQYTDMSLETHKQSLTKTKILHLRIPLRDERGVELVPGSHTKWDTDEEFEVRMEQNGRCKSDDLPHGKAIPLKRGDLLVFSANIIHRGLYGGNRFAFDVIVCDPNPELLGFVDSECLPNPSELRSIRRPRLFLATKNALGLSI